MKSGNNRQYGNYDSRANRIAGGILIILISLIAFLSLVNAFGGAGRMISAFLIGVFGYVAYAYALGGIFVGIMVTVGKRVTLPLNRAAKYVTLYGIALLIFHVWFSKNYFLLSGGGNAKYGAYIAATYHGETAAGVFGSIVTWPFMKLFTPAYALVFFILVFALASVLSFYPVLVNKLPYGTKKTKIKKHGKRAQNQYDVENTVTDVAPRPVGNSMYVGKYEDKSADADKPRKKRGGFSVLFPNEDAAADEEDNATVPAENDSDRRKRAKEKLYQKKKEEKQQQNDSGVVFGGEEQIKPSFKSSPEESRDMRAFDDKGNPRSFSDRFNLPKNEREEAEEFQKRYEYILKSDVTPEDIRGAAKRNYKKAEPRKENEAPSDVASVESENKKSDIPEDMPYFIRDILYGDKDVNKKEGKTFVAKPREGEEDVKPSVANTDDLKIINSVNRNVPPEEPKKNTSVGDGKGSIFNIFDTVSPVKNVEPKPVEQTKTVQNENKGNVAPVLDNYQHGYVPNNKIGEKKGDDVKLGDFSRFENKSDAVMPTKSEIESVNDKPAREEKPRQPFAPKQVEDKPLDNYPTNNVGAGKTVKSSYSASKKEDQKQPNQQISIDQAITAKHQRTPYMAPPIDLLKKLDTSIEKEDFTHQIDVVEHTFSTFHIDAKVIGVTQGPTFSRFELQMPVGIPVGSVTKYADDIAMQLEAKDSIRFETPIPGKNAFGIEVANKKRTPVGLRSVLESPVFNTSKSPLTFGLGRDIGNVNYVCDIDSMPHMLIAGSTGSGKSVCINALIISLLYRCGPNDLKLILIDPKKVELSLYNGIPHMLVPEVIDEVAPAVNALDWCIGEMNKRYDLFKNHAVRNITEYNDAAKQEGLNTLPRIVIIFDELADFMAKMKRQVEDKINSLARLARAAGIHLIVATQRPSVDVITGTIKSNLPSRIAFAVTSAADSMTILGGGGAEKLLGKGDMLYIPQNLKNPVRLQCAFVDGDEVRSVVNYIKDHNESYFDPDAQNAIFRVEEDEEEKDSVNPVQAYAHSAVGKNGETQQFIDALYMCVKEQKASISRIQRKFGVGYGTAANIVDLMEDKGYVSPNKGGNSQRDVLLSMAQYNEIYGDRGDTTEFDLPEDNE